MGFMTGVQWSFIQSIVQTSSNEHFYFSLNPADAENFFGHFGLLVNDVFSPCEGLVGSSASRCELYYTLLKRKDKLPTTPSS